MSHNVIASILEVRVIVWAKARATPLKVVVENEAYAPKDGETYLCA
ncbi:MULTISPECIES: hypothetical protein [unclassified Pseudomonas]|nr:MULTISPECIES: hypothetical protein [unclassified Pseudomonas]QIH05136.1 hypothetical protein ATY02_20850 [Pseudomonas sp. BIOMIG1BAC]